MTLTFGKHKGKEIKAVPDSYLKWLMENCEDDDIQEAAEEEHQWRIDNNHYVGE